MLKMGFAAVDITPGRDAALIGYEFRGKALPPGNAGIFDRLQVRVTVFKTVEGPAVLVSMDLCIIQPKLARDWRKKVAAAAGTVPDRVILACTHTHSGPFPHTGDTGGASIEDASNGVISADSGMPEYSRQVEDALLEAVKAAGGLLLPYNVFYREAPLGIGYNRRVRTVDGLQQCWNPQEQNELNPRNSPDPVFSLLAARQVNGPRELLLWSCGAHPVCLGKTSRMISADWPGRTSALLENGHPNRHSVFFLGACGNIHPWIATQEQSENVDIVARCSASFAELLLQGTYPLGEGEAVLRTVAHTVEFGGREIDLTVWRWGTVWLVALPVELFAELSAGLRARFDAPLFMITNANGWTGYWPHSAAYTEGGYEIDAARAFGRSAGDGEKLMDAVWEMAMSIKD